MLRNSSYNLCLDTPNADQRNNGRTCPVLPPMIRVINVRHPLERLTSAYRQKFGGGHNIICQNTFCQTGLLVDGKLVKKGDNISVSFTEFLEHILTRENNHWNTYNHLCSPCHFKYDYIMHSETMDEDFLYILQKAGLSIPPKMIHRNPSIDRSIQGSSTNTIIQHYFSTVPKSLIDRILKVYTNDMLLFGYSVPDFLNK